MTRYLIFLIIIFLSCGQKQTQNGIDENSQKDNQAYADTAFSYDKHQYFEDIKRFPSDSLIRTITLSDKVVAFNWNDDDRNPANVAHYLVDAYGTFDKSVGLKVELNKKQISKLKLLLADTANYAKEIGICFIPHITFVYYLNDSVIGQTNLCFLCAGQKSVPKTNSEAFSDIGYKNYFEFCKSLGLTMVVPNDK